MTAAKAGTLMQMNKAMYKLGDRHLTDAEAAIQLTVWATALKDVPFGAGQAAMLKAFQVCRFPVTLADLVFQLRAMQTRQDETCGECWAGLMRAARQAANDAGRYGYTFCNPDGRTQGQEAREKNAALFKAQHPAVRRWLGSLDELVSLGRMDNNARRFRRRDFEKAFAEYQASVPLDAARLAGAMGAPPGNDAPLWGIK